MGSKKMPLDTYMVNQIEDNTYNVIRYKSLELMESVEVPLYGPCASSVEKRRKIVNRWLAEGKPQTTAYYFENEKLYGVHIKTEARFQKGDNVALEDGSFGVVQDYDQMNQIYMVKVGKSSFPKKVPYDKVLRKVS
jgi:hypothetical protein